MRRRFKMKKQIIFFVSVCILAFLTSFTSIGQAIDLNRAPLIQTPKLIVALNWYYISPAGISEGPVTQATLQNLYQKKIVNDGTFLWNGTTVTEWTRLSELPSLLKQLKSPKKPLRR